MSDDWQPGDLALCVATLHDSFFGGQGPLQIGAIYSVKRVKNGFDCYGRPGTALLLDRDNRVYPGWAGYNADCFRKIRPHTPDAEDRETIALLNGQPVSVPA